MKLIYKVDLPIYTVSEANCHEHWALKSKRHATQKKWVWAAFRRDCPKIPMPCIVNLKRFGKKNLDCDNLPTSLKYVKDAIADQIIPGLAPGRADDNPGFSWRYQQSIDKEYKVEISIFQLEEHFSLKDPNVFSIPSIPLIVY